MISKEDAVKAAELLQEAAKLLCPNQPYTQIEVLAAFNRGIVTIEKPVTKPLCHDIDCWGNQ